MIGILQTALTYVLVFGLLIFVHELGHFLVAKLFKFQVKEFAFGLPFGKKVARLWHDGETEYTLRAVPFGGFVAFAEIDTDDVTREQQMEAFHAKPIFQRFCVMFAGPLFSFVLGYLAFVAFAGLEGVEDGRPYFKQVVAGKPAALAGIKAGDIVVSVNGESVSRVQLIDRINSAPGQPLTLVVKGEKPEESERTVVVTPAPEKVGKQTIGRIGVVPLVHTRPIQNIGEAFVDANTQTKEFFEGLKRIFKSKERVQESLGGPLGMVQAVSQATQIGFSAIVILVAQLSLSLFAFNLLIPVPVLDGGQILLLVVEAVRRRQLTRDQQMRVMLAGWAILAVFFVFVTFNDISRLFRG